MADAYRMGAGAPLSLDKEVFEADFNEGLVHEVARSEQAARRQGTAATRSRGMVRGGGAKPWRQKGTGRARQGTIRAPQWAGGGIVFGPSPRHYTFKVNRKSRRAALRSVLSLHARRSSLAILDESVFSAPSTKQANQLLTEWARSGRTLIVAAESEIKVLRSFRNLEKVSVVDLANAGVVDIVAAANLVLTDAAVDSLTKLAQKPGQEVEAA